jgi:serine/threonine protein kinase
MRPPTPPDPERLRRVNALLEEALALPAHAREAWLQRLPASEGPLVPSLSAMLARAAVETDTFMRLPVGWETLGEPAEDDQPGDVIGPYRLLRELGAGGMGHVWLAKRIDGTPQRQVALKLPCTSWGAGLARRMRLESEILASLEHPRIARLYEAGATPQGRPWMAMEHVAGLSIDVYCRNRQLGVADRVRLFLQVTDALAHAHARLIVHRDLKPNNILVTMDGEVRLLDFGVAKLLDEDAAPGTPPRTSLTHQIGRAVTPDYASPEQVSGKPVSVATDVYSLGVVLYELLTGQRPYRVGRTSAAALEEAILAADVLPASSRCGNDRALARRLRGDLDTILAKALRKKPADRYATVESLAADLQRHLDGQPVLAIAPSRRYRSLKFLKRNRWALASAGAVTLSITAGLGVALWQAQQARGEAARAEQVKEFIASVLRQAQPRSGVGGVVTASELLTSAAERIERELADNPRMAAELGVIVGHGFSELGEPSKGEAPLRAAVERAERSYGRLHPVTIHGKALLAESINDTDMPQAERLLNALVPDAIAGLPATAEDASFALRSLSYVLAKRDQEEPSYAALHQAIELAERHLGPLHQETIHTIGLLSNTYGRFERRPEQLETATTSVERARQVFGKQRPHPILTIAERNYGVALRASGQPADAEPVLRRVLMDQRTLEGDSSYRVVVAMLQLARALFDMGRANDALQLMRDSVALEARINATDTEDRRTFASELVNMLTLTRRTAEALALDAHLQAIAVANGKEPESWALRHQVRRAMLRAQRGDTDADALPPDAFQRLTAYPQLKAEAGLVTTFHARMQRRPEAAIREAEKVIEQTPATALRPMQHGWLLAQIGSAWLDLGDTRQAALALLRSRELYAQAQVEPGVRMSDVLVAQARLALLTRKPAQAESLVLPLVTAWEDVNPGSPWHGEALLWLSRAEAAQGRRAAAQVHRRAAQAMLAPARLPALRQLAASGP